MIFTAPSSGVYKVLVSSTFTNNDLPVRFSAVKITQTGKFKKELNSKKWYEFWKAKYVYTEEIISEPINLEQFIILTDGEKIECISAYKVGGATQ